MSIPFDPFSLGSPRLSIEETRAIQLEQWREFYRHKYKINLDYRKIKKLDKIDYSRKIIIVSDLLDSQKVFDGLSSQVGEFLTNISDPNSISDVRKIPSSYMINPDENPTMLEIMLADSFGVYHKINIVQNSKDWRKDCISHNSKVSITAESTDSSDYIFRPEERDGLDPWDLHIVRNRHDNIIYSVTLNE